MRANSRKSPLQTSKCREKADFNRAKAPIALNEKGIYCKGIQLREELLQAIGTNAFDGDFNRVD